jgi:hypothetical protein
MAMYYQDFFRRSSGEAAWFFPDFVSDFVPLAIQLCQGKWSFFAKGLQSLT